MRLTKVAVVALLLLPIIEIVVIVAVGEAIGGWPTFLLHRRDVAARGVAHPP